MPLRYTGDDLIESVRNLIPVPGTNSPGFQDADILRHLTEALRIKLVPVILRLHQEYFVQEARISLSGLGTTIRIPSRASASRLRDLHHFDGTSTRTPINPISRDQLTDLSGEVGTSLPQRYYIVGQFIQLVPTTGTYGGTLDIAYFFQPSQIVKQITGRQITTVNAGTKTVTLGSAIPAGWTTAALFDVHGQDSGAEVRQFDAAATVVSGTGITFTNEIDGSGYGTHAIAVGDWVCIAGESVIPAIPIEIMPMLIEATAFRIAQSLQDTPAMAIHKAEFKDQVADAAALMGRRVDTNPRLIIGRGGFFHRGGGW